MIELANFPLPLNFIVSIVLVLTACEIGHKLGMRADDRVSSNLSNARSLDPWANASGVARLGFLNQKRRHSLAPRLNDAAQVMTLRGRGE